MIYENDDQVEGPILKFIIVSLILPSWLFCFRNDRHSKLFDTAATAHLWHKLIVLWVELNYGILQMILKMV